jgi:hypothetical protein
MRPQTKTGGNKDETDIKIYEEQMVAPFRCVLHAGDSRIHHIHGSDSAHSHGRLHGIHDLYAWDRALEFRITPPDNLM